jgi:hypothetical protein
MDWGALAIAAVTGLAAGVVGSLIAPWVQLAVENGRNQQQQRRERINAWRRMLTTSRRVSRPVVDDPDFLSLRPHLDPEIRRRLEMQSGTEENPAVVHLGAEGIAAVADLALVAGEVDRLERQWKLT